MAIKVIEYKELDRAARKMIAYIFVNCQSREQHNADFLPPTVGAVQKLFPDKNAHVHNHRAVPGEGLI